MIECMLWLEVRGFHVSPLLYNTIFSVSVIKLGHGPCLSPIQLGCLLWSWKVLNAPLRMQSEAWAIIWPGELHAAVLWLSNKGLWE